MTSTEKDRGKNGARGRQTAFASFVHAVQRADATTKALWGSVAVAVVVMAAVVIMIIAPPQPVSAPQNQEIENDAPRNPLSGVRTDTIDTDQLPRVFAVMVENSADAWPLSGLADAFLVIEAPVEGMIPRFEAFFDVAATTEKIGPVRSARPYYLNWADELDAVYAHVGGSPEALGLIASFGTIDLNEFFQGEYFYRSSQRGMPHNVYTTMDNLRDALDNELQLDAPEYGVWTFKDGQASGEAKSFVIDWTSGQAYDIAWDYDAETNAYVRDQGGTSNFLEGGVNAIAQNVVIMETDIEVVDAVGRRHIRTTGDGDALIAQDGRIIIATWKKDDRTSRLRFYDSTNNEIAMNAGATWIEVVGSLGQATVENSER